MGEREYLVVLDVPHVVAGRIVASLVCPEKFPAFLADPDLVLTVDSEDAHLIPCYASPLPDAELPGETVLRPLLPIYRAGIPQKATFAVGEILVILVGEARTGGFDAGDHMVEEIGIPIHAVRIHLGEADTHVRVEVGGGVPDAADLLAGVDLLDNPAGIVPTEPVGVETAVEKTVEVRGQFPTVLLHPPGMEYRYSCGGADILEGQLHVLREIVELPPGLHETFGDLLRRGDDPMADVADVFALLLMETLVGFQLRFSLHTLAEGGVVNALVARHGPAVMPLALAVVFRVIGTPGVDDTSCGRYDEAAALVDGTLSVPPGHGPADVFVILGDEFDGVPIPVAELENSGIRGRGTG